MKQKQLTIKQFKHIVYEYYATNKRIFAWRETTNPYHIVVSEIMLQQTQTERVKIKYEEFIQAFPTIELLAQAFVSDVITVWTGLGYNRRALALHALAQQVVQDYQGTIPTSEALLRQFKGIGPATAASICAFAYNKPTIFIETNVRAVFIHHFFPHKHDVNDKEIEPLVKMALDRQQPREWYYALMDYGVMLKSTYDNPSRRSKHYSVQSKFEGSQRQVRGKILKLLIELPLRHKSDFFEQIQRNPAIIEKILIDLEQEGFILNNADVYQLRR